MLENIYSNTAFDAVKGSNAPRPNSVEPTHSGKAFQSHYSASGKDQTAADRAVQPDTVETKKTDAADDSNSVPSTDVTKQSKPKGPEIDLTSTENGEVDVAVSNAEVSEISHPSHIRLGVDTFSLGATADTKVQNDPAANTNKTVLAAKTEIGSVDLQPGQPPRDEKPGQAVHQSIAELRLTSAQSETAKPHQTTETNVLVSKQNPSITPSGNPLSSNAATEGGKNVGGILASGDSAGQNAPVLQPAPQNIRGPETRRANDLTSGPTSKLQTAQVAAAMGGGQSQVPNSTEALQRLMTPIQDEQAAPVAEEVLTRDKTQPTRQAKTSAPVVVTQAGSTTQAVSVGQTGISVAEALVDPLNASLMSEPIFFEPAGLSQLLTEAVMSPGTTHRPETPRLVAAQLAEALATKGERNIDVALNPEELGRVKMRVTTTDTSVIVTITTERPETGDLMRRHINELSEEFRRMGFEDISFEFGGEGMSGQMGEGDEQENSPNSGATGASDGDRSAENAQKPEQQNLRLGETGLDMRI